VSAKICHRKAASNTGLVGITETTRRGRARLTVSWRPAKGVVKATTIYFGPPTILSRAEALEIAQDLRRRAIAARAAREGAVR
jgi:hypothetical protein